MAKFVNLFVTVCLLVSFELSLAVKLKRTLAVQQTTVIDPTVNASSVIAPVDCSCGVFLSGQIVRGSSKSPLGSPALTVEIEDEITCGALGVSKCSSKCLEEMVKFLPTSSSIICASIDRDIYKEKAYLFVNVCDQGWTKTRISTQKEICCKNSADYKCPPTS